MKTKLFTIAMMVALLLAAITRGQAQEYDGPCLPPTHGLDDHQSAFCGSILTQTIALSAGTNWFSTYVEITLEDLQAALDAVNTNNKSITIKAQNANSIYVPRTHKWNNGSLTWDVANMYQIVLTEACEITLEGAPIDPTEHEITIAGGGVATWIGFPFSESMTLTNAFAALPPTNGDNVKYQSANAIYARNKWSSGIANLEPGKGYIYVSAASAGDRTLVFPTDTKRAANWNGFNLNVKNTAKDTPYRIMKKAIKGVAKTVNEPLTKTIKQHNN